MIQDDIRDCALCCFSLKTGLNIWCDIWNCGFSVFWSFASGQCCSFPHAATRSLLGNHDMNIIFHQWFLIWLLGYETQSKYTVCRELVVNSIDKVMSVSMCRNRFPSLFHVPKRGCECPWIRAKRWVYCNSAGKESRSDLIQVRTSTFVYLQDWCKGGGRADFQTKITLALTSARTRATGTAHFLCTLLKQARKIKSNWSKGLEKKRKVRGSRETMCLKLLYVFDTWWLNLFWGKTATQLGRKTHH